MPGQVRLPSGRGARPTVRRRQRCDNCNDGDQGGGSDAYSSLVRQHASATLRTDYGKKGRQWCEQPQRRGGSRGLGPRTPALG